MLEKKNIRILDDVLDSFRQGQGKHVEKQGNNWNVTELLGCRRKVEFRRANTPYKFVETDFSRQGKIANFVHSSMQVELRKMGWETEVKFVKKIGKYTLHCRVDGLLRVVEEGTETYESMRHKYLHSEITDEEWENFLDHRATRKLIEIKVPMWNSTDKKGIPEYYKIQVGAYLNITGAEECKLMILAKNAFTEPVLTEALEDDDLVWMIEEGALSPSFDKECDNCFYESLCEYSKKKR